MTQTIKTPLDRSVSLWLIDDDPALRLILADTFTDAGFVVSAFTHAQAAWMRLNDIQQGDAARSELPDVILTDIRMPMMDGLSFSEWVQQHFPELPIIIMTAHSDLQSAVDSYQTGAFDYLPKPFDLDDAVAVVSKASQRKPNPNPKLDHPHQSSDLSHETIQNTVGDAPSHVTSHVNSKRRDSRDNGTSTSNNSRTTHHSQNKASTATAQHSDSDANQSPNHSKDRDNPSSTTTTTKANTKPTANSTSLPSGIIGQSVAMQTVFRAIGRLANSPITVLITGESGTGKELVAGALHQHSPRRKQPFIALNMAAIPQDLIESELFGHEKGAFTGATAMRQGRFEQANGGTLFLDEIGDMPFGTQTRLLRVLANGEFFRVGGQKPVRVDVRIIAATHQNLELLVKQGKFREDLFYRLNVIRLPLPPLRQRPEDIPALVNHFMSRAATEMATSEKNIHPDAMTVMQAYDWLGNVRQLENACRWLTVMATGDTVLIDDLPPELSDFAKQLDDNTSSGHIAIDNLVNNNTANESKISKGLTDTGMSTAEYEQHLATQTATTYPQSQQPEYTKQPSLTSTAAQLSHHHTRPNGDISPDTHYSLQHWKQPLQHWVQQTLANEHSDILQTALPEFESTLINAALTHTHGRKGEAAQLLGWGRNTLTRKLQQLGLDEYWK